MSSTKNYIFKYLSLHPKPSPPLPLISVAQAHYFREVAGCDDGGFCVGLEHLEIGRFGGVHYDAVVLAEGDDASVS